MNKISVAVAVVGVLSCADASANSFKNGDFSINNAAAIGGPGQINYGQTVSGWYVPDKSGQTGYVNGANKGYTFLFSAATADTTGSGGNGKAQYNSLSLYSGAGVTPYTLGSSATYTADPAGDAWIIGQDSDYENQPIEQNITGLTIGKTYTVGFYYAYGQQQTFSGDTTQVWNVSLGDSAAQQTTQVVNPSHGFSGWYSASLSFVADATSETLKFAASGGPPVPPFALLSGVTFTPDAVPEPAAWTMMILGVAGIGAVARRRRAGAANRAAAAELA